MLRTGLGEIANAVWEGKTSAGMHSKLLDSMNNSEKLTGKPMTRELAIAQIIGILFAGHESTANVIAECLYELARNQHVQTQLRNELLAFTERTGRAPTYDDLMNGSQLQYLDAVTRETMRTKPVLMYIARETLSKDYIPLGTAIHGTGSKHVKVERGQIVHIPVRDGINVDEALWGKDAAVFRPERWMKDELPAAARDIHAPGNVMTFGDGSKICLGRHFALAEFKIIISTLVQHLVFELDNMEYVFFKCGSNTVKPKIRGREHEGHQMFLRIRKSQGD